MTTNITNELLSLGKVGSMMDTTTFWNIIEKANNNANDTKTFNKNIKAELILLDLKSLIEFNQRYYDINRDLGTYGIRDAHLKMNDNDPVEPTMLFHMWIIAKGKDIYDLALKTPEKLVKLDGYIPYDMELIKTVELSKKVFKKKTNENMQSYIDYSIRPKNLRIGTIRPR